MLRAASLIKNSGVLSLAQKARLSRRLKATSIHKPAAYLELEDGTVLEGKPFGASRSCTGEVVFNTGMVGYPESLSDPSYKNQILTLTYPIIGNYGVPPKTKDSAGLLKFFESDKIHISGLVVGDYTDEYSHWNAVQSLGQWLQSEGIPALSGIDTRSLTRILRERGCMAGKIVINNNDLPIENPLAENLVAELSIKEPKTYGNGDIKIIAVDCGMKYNIIRQLTSLPNTTIKIVPWNYDFTKEHYDGLFLSNGPGDPALVTETIEHVKKAIDLGRPIFGICLGNQLLGLAAGAQTIKLKYGNRGQNQPVMDLTSNQVYITPQNHGFAVDVATLPADWLPYMVNANDGSNEGIMHVTKPIFSVQFHPEARGGPYDTQFLFQKFYTAVTEYKAKQRMWENKNFNTKVKPSKVLIIGSGALQIGQAGEFDYSGSQCIKALKEEGVKSVLVNPNIATVQTSKGVADQVYFLPATAEYIEHVIQKERPDGILLGFGGQTGLNTGVELAREGVFKKYGVEVLGSSVETIEATEDRELFNRKLAEIHEPFAKSFAVTSVEDALTAAKSIQYPVVVRAAYALGGLGSGFAANPKELAALAARALSSAPQILVEKSLKGWKEVEYEVVRDQNNNCITVCNMENFDPMGIHTGDSIVVAPSQTLTNEEYHMLRSAAIRIVQHLGIIGECNIQYALNPKSQEYIVIEVNPRLSRSSALASKATGYPLAFVAAKIAVGVPLPRIQNSVTKSTLACFEPSLDYIVTKVPRWDLAKFKQVDPHLGSSMKSVGEVMAIGRTWEESIQKALRMVDTSNMGFEAKFNGDVDDELARPTPQRIFAIAKAFDQGYSVDKIHDITKIDKWFLNKLHKISVMRDSVKSRKSLASVDLTQMKAVKQAGFSDKQIGSYINAKENDVREYRKSLGVVPQVKQIDTLAAEFPAKTNYLYMTYNATASDIPEDKGGVMVLGSGTYRIGSSVEFDYGAVSCARSLTRQGQKTIMVNYNPETVSTDYDESDKLYFEELSLERVLDIHDRENPLGTVVSVGGQQPQNIALSLHNNGVNVLGTKATNIDIAEDRYKFSKLLDSIGVAQPEWKELSSMAAAKEFASKVGYPVLIRPSYVLSGAAMNVADDEHQLETFLTLAADVNPDHPVVITKFVTGAKEVELDAVAQNGQLINWAIAEHIEHAGVHSGDATMVLPAHDLPASVQEEVKLIGTKIATALNINGPCNIQFLVKDNRVSVIECNLRASRSVPFASKTYDVDFIDTATKVFLGKALEPNQKCAAKLNHVAVKAPQFSYQRLLGADPVPGIEMTSTGEVACFGDNKYEAFLKSMISVPPYFKLPNKHRTILLSGNVTDSFIPSAKTLVEGGYKLYASSHVAPLLDQYGVRYTLLSHKEDDSELINHILHRKVDLVINFPSHNEDPVNFQIRRRAVDYGVPCLTNEQICGFLATALTTVKEMSIKSYADYWPEETVKKTTTVDVIVSEEQMSSK